jgi:Protein of unknown function (DUF1592)/Protein of unknown function (DUF1588)/Protein of unknown function (DUF1585)/Protein of unknown function (DUF1587)/Protein of unknown function (DUF1595)/Cytochrome C oxidase, cbb3-type, subunit III
MSRILQISGIVLASAFVLAAQAPATPKAFIDRYCAGCHSNKTKAGGLSLESLNPENPAAAPEAWEKVVRKLRVRYMPPAGLPRPDEGTYDAVVARLEAALDAGAAGKPNPGRTDTFRRLNRTEYRNAVRDLLGIEVDVSSLLPKDDSSHGFDNITVGELSPTLLDRYLAAARKITRLALGLPDRSPGGDVLLVAPDLTQENHLDELPFGTRGGQAISYNFVADGEYEIQLRLTRDRNEHIEGLTEPHQAEISIDGARVALLQVKPPRQQDHQNADRDLHVRAHVNAGPHVVAAAFLAKSSALPETDRQPYQSRFNMDRHPRIQPALYSIAITGPFDGKGAGDTPSRRRILVCRPAAAADEEPCAKAIFSELARRAYRRPVKDAEVAALLRFYKDGRSGGSFEDGVEEGLRALLTSPGFLFRIERDPAGAAPGTVYPVSDIDLASRLSFFLWSSIPDEDLLQSAIQGKLHNPAELTRQTRRMLADPRSESLVDNFAEQWLYLRNLAAVTPEVRLFTDFDDNLREAMRRETEMLFESVMREDRNVLDLIRADYTFLNERLAKHYGIPGIYGSRFRRLQLQPGDPRGGLLGQASILTVTSYPTRTSPVLRGKWILANLLGTPPPSPPPNVPKLQDKADPTKELPMRERLAEHRRNPACSGCHQLMDPSGFALENFDAVGRWRTNENGAPVDASGSLPGGNSFSGPAGLRQAILNRPDLFVSTLTEKLLTYALGRGLEPYDAPAVRRIANDAQPQDYRFSAIVLGVVNSTAFQKRRAQ